MSSMFADPVPKDAIIPALFLILAPIPVYYFINWIFSGFKKDKKVKKRNK